MSWKNSLQPRWKGLSGAVSQPLCCQTPRQRLLDLCATFKIRTKSQLDLHTEWSPENKISRNQSRQQLKETVFPKITGQSLNTVYLCSPLICPSLSWPSLCLQKGNISDYWIPQKLQSVPDVGDPSVLSVSLNSNSTVDYTRKPTGITYCLRLL